MQTVRANSLLKLFVHLNKLVEAGQLVKIDYTHAYNTVHSLSGVPCKTPLKHFSNSNSFWVTYCRIQRIFGNVVNVYALVIFRMYAIFLNSQELTIRMIGVIAQKLCTTHFVQQVSWFMEPI